MLLKNPKIAKVLLFIVVVLSSVLLLFIGNRFATKDLTAFDSGESLETMTVEVLKIISEDTSEYALGGEENYTKRVIVFSAKVLDNGEMRDKTITATQTIDTLLGNKSIEVQAGDRILVNKTAGESENLYEWVAGDHIRTPALLILGAVFAVLLLIFGRAKGVSTLVSLVFTCMAVFAVFIPATLSGQNIYLWAVLTCVFIIAMTLLVVYGASGKSLAAGIGCAGGVVISAVLSLVMSRILLLTGMTDDDAVYLSQLNPDNPINLKAIIFASIIIGALGGIMDVAVSMASSLTEVHENSAEPTFRSLFKSGISIGRDIMGANVNTLILAYIGSSMSIVLLLIANNSSLLKIMNREMIVVEILQALIGSFGILLTIPLTSLVCAFFYTKKAAGLPKKELPQKEKAQKKEKTAAKAK